MDRIPAFPTDRSTKLHERTLTNSNRSPEFYQPIYTTSDGLAHDRVHRIVRDSRGLLWFCTGEGLSRFDGYQFKNYSRDDGLPHRSIHDLFETPDGSYWLATGDGLVLFNPQGVARRWRGFEDNAASDETLMFRVFQPEDESHGTLGLRISRLQRDAAGTLWAATGRGLYRADKIGRDWKLQGVEKKEWSNKEDFEALLQDNSGALWELELEASIAYYRMGKCRQISETSALFPCFKTARHRPALVHPPTRFTGRLA